MIDAVTMRRMERLRLIEQIKNAIKEANPADKEKLIAHVCLAVGCARRKILEILSLLQTDDQIKVKGGNIWLN